MKKQSKIFFFIFFIFATAVVVFSYYKYCLLEDYFLQIKVSCNPKEEKCFAVSCDASVDENCDPEEKESISYHKFIRKKADSFSLCENGTQKCVFVCQPNEDCEEIFCSEADLNDGEWCAGFETKRSKG